MTIKEIQQRLTKTTKLTDPFLQQLKHDERKGVQKLIASKIREIKHLQEQTKSFDQRLRYERQFWHRGINYIAGVDEVGRGPLAGPVVTCAIILPHDFNLILVNDSKQLTPKQRLALYPQILDQALAVSLGVASNQVIDKVNIYQATRLAMLDAVENLAIIPDSLLIDAMQLDTNIAQTELFHGDAKSVTVGAASIVAKVYRDHLMDQYATVYPDYGFEHNAGYGTKQHLTALKKDGITPIHRRTFNPVTKIIKKQ